MYGWTNATSADDDGVVWKRFLGPAPQHRYRVERGMLLSLAGRFPVADVVGERDPWMLGTARVAGRSGLEASALGVSPSVVYRNLGAALRLLHAIDPSDLEVGLDGDGPAVVHGDYGAHNVVIGEGGVVAAVVDWERARRGEPVEDLAWAEWIAAVMFPVPPGAIDALYDGYGTTFSPNERRHGLDRACAAFVQRFSEDRWPPGADWFITSAARSFRFPDL